MSGRQGSKLAMEIYKCLVMPSSLTNFAAVFQFMINYVLRPILDHFGYVYLDHNLIPPIV